jgi:hypothetical protein
LTARRRIGERGGEPQQNQALPPNANNLNQSGEQFLYLKPANLKMNAFV